MKKKKIHKCFLFFIPEPLWQLDRPTMFLPFDEIDKKVQAELLCKKQVEYWRKALSA